MEFVRNGAGRHQLSQNLQFSSALWFNFILFFYLFFLFSVTKVQVKRLYVMVLVLNFAGAISMFRR